MFLARQSLREISPIPGKWFSRWNGFNSDTRSVDTKQSLHIRYLKSKNGKETSTLEFLPSQHLKGSLPHKSSFAVYLRSPNVFKFDKTVPSTWPKINSMTVSWHNVWEFVKNFINFADCHFCSICPCEIAKPYFFFWSTPLSFQ